MHTMKPYHVHLWWDPAIDADKSDVRQYVNSRDPKNLTPRKGKKLQTFVCRPVLNDALVNRMMALPTLNEARQLAFRASVFEVRNPVTLDGSNPAALQPRALTDRQVEADEVTDGGKATLVPSEDAGMLWDPMEVRRTFDPTTELEVGEVIRARAFLPAGIAPAYVLPPSSLRLARLHGHLYAVVDPEGAQRVALAARSVSKELAESEGLGAADVIQSLLDSPIERSNLVSLGTEG